MKHLFIATLCPFFWLWLSSASLWAQGDATFTISTAPLDPAIESGIAGESITYDVQGGECVDSGFCQLPDMPAGSIIAVKFIIE